jgi:hypothetical protein
MEWKNAIGKDGRPNGERYGVDNELTAKVYNKARKHYMVAKLVAATKHFGMEIGREGAVTAAGMGAQQALGLLLAELSDALFDEIKDICTNGFKGGSLDKAFFLAVKERFTRVGQRLLSRWADAVDAFKTGALAGLLSVIVTTLINTVLTTAKRLVRLIREGGRSLLRAVMLLANPPDGMSSREAVHEASKIILAGAIVIGGVALDEIVSKWTAGIPLADTVTTVIVGLATGLGTVLGTYMIDKVDLFGVIGDARQNYVVAALSHRFDDAATAIEDTLAALEPVRLLT